MTAAHVRRGAPARPKQRKAAKPKRAASKASHARVNRLAGLAFGAFLLAMGVVVVIALDIPSKAATSAGSAPATGRRWSAASRSPRRSGTHDGTPTRHRAVSASTIRSMDMHRRSCSVGGADESPVVEGRCRWLA